MDVQRKMKRPHTPTPGLQTARKRFKEDEPEKKKEEPADDWDFWMPEPDKKTGQLHLHLRGVIVRRDQMTRQGQYKIGRLKEPTETIDRVSTLPGAQIVRARHVKSQLPVYLYCFLFSPTVNNDTQHVEQAWRQAARNKLAPPVLETWTIDNVSPEPTIHLGVVAFSVPAHTGPFDSREIAKRTPVQRQRASLDFQFRLAAFHESKYTIGQLDIHHIWQQFLSNGDVIYWVVGFLQSTTVTSASMVTVDEKTTRRIPNLEALPLLWQQPRSTAQLDEVATAVRLLHTPNLDLFVYRHPNTVDLLMPIRLSFVREDKEACQFELLSRLSYGQYGSVWTVRLTRIAPTLRLTQPRLVATPKLLKIVVLGPDTQSAEALALEFKTANLASEVGLGPRVYLDGEYQSTDRFPQQVGYFVMDFIEHATTLGHSLSQLDREERIRLLLDLAHRLCAFHAQGAVHRDIHRNNILLETTNVAARAAADAKQETIQKGWLVDYGLTSLFDPSLMREIQFTGMYLVTRLSTIPDDKILDDVRQRLQDIVRQYLPSGKELTDWQNADLLALAYAFGFDIGIPLPMVPAVVAPAAAPSLPVQSQPTSAGGSIMTTDRHSNPLVDAILTGQSMDWTVGTERIGYSPSKRRIDLHLAANDDQPARLVRCLERILKLRSTQFFVPIF
jgi:hypothetical protein